MNTAQHRSKTFEVLAETLKAAAHPERLAILKLLWGSNAHSMRVKSVCESLSMEQSSVSRHLGILKRCGLLVKEGTGNNSIYKLNLENGITLSMIDCMQHT